MKRVFLLTAALVVEIDPDDFDADELPSSIEDLLDRYQDGINDEAFTFLDSEFEDGLEACLHNNQNLGFARVQVDELTVEVKDEDEETTTDTS